MFRPARALLPLALSALLGVHPVAQDDDRTLRVFVFAGQSNMVGSDSKVADIDRYPPFRGLGEPQPDVRFAYSIGRETKQESNGWVPLAPIGGGVGPELAFARRVKECIEAPIAIIKCAAGGTHLGGDWNPDDPQGFAMYPRALELVREALGELERRNVRFRLEGFVWHQGENDMFDDGFRAAYGENLARFLECWRRDLGAPDLRFYIGEHCTKTIWGMDNRMRMDAIATGQRAVCAADSLAQYVPTAHVGVEIGGGNGLHYHYGTLGQLEQGVDYAEAYLARIGQLPEHQRALPRWPYGEGAKVRLFVLAGHRNMEGERAFVQDLQALRRSSELVEDDPKIAYRYEVGGGRASSGGWEPLGPAGPYQTFGPELSFAARIRSETDEPFAIAKFTHSGSQMIDWTPEGSDAKSRNLHDRFVRFIEEAVDDLESRGHQVELAGVFYHLGENDMSYFPYRRAAAARLAAMIAGVRERLSQPDLVFFTSQQPPTDHDSVNDVDVVTEVASVIQKDSNLVHVRAFDLPEQAEALVLDARGVVALGRALANAWLER